MKASVFERKLKIQLFIKTSIINILTTFQTIYTHAHAHAHIIAGQLYNRMKRHHCIIVVLGGRIHFEGKYKIFWVQMVRPGSHSL